MIHSYIEYLVNLLLTTGRRIADGWLILLIIFQMKYWLIEIKEKKWFIVCLFAIVVKVD